MEVESVISRYTKSQTTPSEILLHGPWRTKAKFFITTRGHCFLNVERFLSSSIFKGSEIAPILSFQDFWVRGTQFQDAFCASQSQARPYYKPLSYCHSLFI